MCENILGIDLGTSSVKILLRHSDGKIEKARANYTEKSPTGFLIAIKDAVKKLDVSDLCAIGLSSQVGTYIVNDTEMISWDAPIGREELETIKKKYSNDVFVQEIAMPHPDIISYPIPRLMYIMKHYNNVFRVCQPKDYLCGILTGNCVTDKYSFRGLVHTKKGKYSDLFLKEIGIDEGMLPKIVSPEEMVGMTTANCEKLTGIPKNIPVYAGLNDFFSSLVGMGISDSGDMFDITGTSEHIGIICDDMCVDTSLVSGVYFDKFIHYGVTASSGASLDFGLREFGFEEISPEDCLRNNPPIFTPYVNGERAPIYASDARGVFFGINSYCTRRDMAYAVLEGVAFSIFHIYENMNMPECSNIIISGGASKNKTLNQIKAELFQKKVYTLSENDTSALGAIQVAATGLGKKLDRSVLNSVVDSIVPDGKIREILLKRYNIYKKIYHSLKDEFLELNNIGKD